MRVLLPVLVVAAFGPTGPAWAEGHGVTVVNAGNETIRRIEIGTPDNRLRSQLPPGAQARITYSTGCQADVRLGFESGRTEAFAGVDVCSDPRLETGKGVTASGPAVSSAAASPGATSSPRSGSASAATAVATSSPVKAPPPVVPPWTGKSITKRFGGLD